MSDNYIEHNTDILECSAYHFHHNREPFYILFIKVLTCNRLYRGDNYICLVISQ